MPQIINLENICYSYSSEKKLALDNINLSIEEGEFLAVMGENGSGKTTFCKIINGIIPHHYGGHFSGTVTVDGECTKDSSVSHLALKAGMVFDDPDAQLFTSSVRHEAAFGPENLMLPADKIEERVAQALYAAGLSGFEDRQPSTLSGGEKQRLAIAAALAMRWKILVLDEPLCRLDPDGENEVMSVLRDVREKYRMTVIMTAHNSKKVQDFADRVCILKNGRVAACDTAKRIFFDSSLLDECGVQPPAAVDINAVFSRKTETNETDTPAIKISNLCFSYKKSNLRMKNVNLSIMDNDFTAIIGHNGCGKTTLLKCITGLLRPDAGDIFVRGKNTKKLSVSAISKEAGFVMQNPDSQLFTDSVYNEAGFALVNAGLPKTEIQQRVRDALDAVGLENPDAFPHALSRADRTKTVIACVLAMGCKIVIFDEIDVGQDYRGSLKLMNIAKDLHSKGYTIIFVTHNMSLVCEYAHTLILMEKDGIVEYKKKEDNELSHKSKEQVTENV